jgi:hypothetical protein
MEVDFQQLWLPKLLCRTFSLSIKIIEDAEDKPLRIEIKLHRHLDQFNQRWDKIR